MKADMVFTKDVSHGNMDEEIDDCYVCKGCGFIRGENFCEFKVDPPLINAEEISSKYYKGEHSVI